MLTFSQNYEKEGDDLFAQAQYEQAEKKYKAAIAIVGESQTIKQKQDKCTKCKNLLTKAQTAEKESRYSDAAKYYSNLYAIHALPKYQSKANAMKQKEKQREKDRIAKIEEEKRKAELERQTKIDERTLRGRLSNGFTWKFFEGTLTIYGEDLLWKFGRLEGNPWCNSSFRDSIKTIIISEPIINIANLAFDGCTNLTSVSIPQSVKKIGAFAFRNCKKLESITIPKSVSSIEEYAFDGCSKLSSITIPYGVKIIRHRTFRDCANLRLITLPSSLTHIDIKAFSNCRSLSSITIPESVTFIGEQAFENCNNLSIRIPKRFKGNVNLSDCKNVTYY